MLVWKNKFKLKPNRWVFEPSDASRRVGKGILRDINRKWSPPVYFYHHQEGGHVAAVRVHLKNSYFFSLDIENYFNSINKTRLTRVLQSIFPYKLARKMANESVVRNPDEKRQWILPYGFCQSTILASLALDRSALGTFLRECQKRKDVDITVYVDDIIFSSNDVDLLKGVEKEALSKIEKSKFLISKRKSQETSAAITVFNIEISNNLMRISDARVREFRGDLVDASSNMVAGIESYVRSVNPSQVADLYI